MLELTRHPLALLSSLRILLHTEPRSSRALYVPGVRPILTPPERLEKRNPQDPPVPIPDDSFARERTVLGEEGG